MAWDAGLLRGFASNRIGRDKAKATSKYIQYPTSIWSRSNLWTGPAHPPSWWLLRHLSWSCAPGNSQLLKSNFTAELSFFFSSLPPTRQLYFLFLFLGRSCYCSVELFQEKSTSLFECYLKIALPMYQSLYYQVGGAFWCEDGSYRLSTDQERCPDLLCGVGLLFQKPRKEHELSGSHKAASDAICLPRLDHKVFTSG